MSLFTKKPIPQTLEQEYDVAVRDLIELEKVLGSARQQHILLKTDDSKQKVWQYQKMIDTLQKRLIKLGDRINKRDMAV